MSCHSIEKKITKQITGETDSPVPGNFLPRVSELLTLGKPRTGQRDAGSKSRQGRTAV